MSEVNTARYEQNIAFPISNTEDRKDIVGYMNIPSNRDVLTQESYHKVEDNLISWANQGIATWSIRKEFLTLAVRGTVVAWFQPAPEVSASASEVMEALQSNVAELRQFSLNNSLDAALEGL